MKKSCKIATGIIAPLLITIIFLLKSWIICAAGLFPECSLHRLSGYYCPGCGNTRSVICLLNGDVIGSLHNNITPIFLIMLLVLLYAELLFSIFEKKIKLLPRNNIFWFTVMGMVLLYYLMRNFFDIIAPIDS